MPKLVKSELCCGCSACANKCAKGAIKMQPNEEGFMHPIVDYGLCVDCGACENVCPGLIVQSNKNTPLPNKDIVFHPRTFIIQHKDDAIRYQSTSGGAFTAIAEEIIKLGGVVFGAVMTEDMKVKHISIDRVESLALFRNSKYVQSEIGDCYKQTKSILNTGRSVCFSGTPCQIKGLKAYLGREYKNLITVDVVCKSVPSPLIFGLYVELKQQQEGEIADIVFRDKKRGFLYCKMAHYKSHEARKKGESIYRRGSESDEYLRLFLSGKISRNSCLFCPYQASESAADFTLGDIWETGCSSFDDDKGTTQVNVRSEKGMSLLNDIHTNIHCEELLKKPLVPLQNKKISQRYPIYSYRDQLFHDANELSAEDFFNKYAPYRGMAMVKNVMRNLLWRVGLQSTIRHLKHLIIHRKK